MIAREIQFNNQLLYVTLDVGYLPRESFDALFAMANEASRVINGLRASIDRTRN